MQNNIRSIRKGLGWTMEQLAERVEGQPHYTTIAKLERNVRGLTQDWMVKIAAALGVPPQALITDVEASQMRFVPLVGRIAAGNWQEAIQHPDRMVLAPYGGPNVFALQPQGDSMNRVIMDGAYVLIDPDQRELNEGKIYAVMRPDGDTTLKMYRSAPPRLVPCSDNPVHQPIVFGEEPFTIVGKAYWQGQDL